MGYTHYWRQSGSFSNAQWDTITDAAHKIIAHANKSGLPLVYDYDEPNKPPELSANCIRFNGLGDDGHETFYLSPGRREVQRYEGEDTGFNFCKTARKPYDVPVVALLIAARNIAPDVFTWSSDGTRREHAKGAQFLAAATGIDIGDISNVNTEE